jgi:cation-transporting ATPase 13A1
MPKFMDLYKEQMIQPFFVFQVFCVLLWLLDDYFYYSLFILALLLVFEATVVRSVCREFFWFEFLPAPLSNVMLVSCSVLPACLSFVR